MHMRASGFFVGDFFKSVSRWTFKTGDKRPGIVVFLVMDWVLGWQSWSTLYNLLPLQENLVHSYLETPSTNGLYCSLFHSKSILDILKWWKGKESISNNWDRVSSQVNFSLYHSIETQIQWTLITSSRDIIIHLPQFSFRAQSFFWQGQETSKS